MVPIARIFIELYLFHLYIYIFYIHCTTHSIVGEISYLCLSLHVLPRFTSWHVDGHRDVVGHRLLGEVSGARLAAARRCGAASKGLCLWSAAGVESSWQERHSSEVIF